MGHGVECMRSGLPQTIRNCSTENSPAPRLRGWVLDHKRVSPVSGTEERRSVGEVNRPIGRSFRPWAGTRFSPDSNPSVETLGYCQENRQTRSGGLQTAVVDDGGSAAS